MPLDDPLQTARQAGRLLAAMAALVGLAMAATLSIRTALADYQMRRGTVEGMSAAIALAPDNAEYPARLAFLLREVDPSKAGAAVRRAIELNPWDSASWVDLGLRAEAERDEPRAQQCLLRAAEVDRKFLPRWTLANYYMRHGDTARVWMWAKQAAAMVYGDARPLFRLCGRVREDGRLIERLEIRDPDVRGEYLAYLVDQNRLDLVAPAVERVLRENRAADGPLLMTVCEKLLEAGRPSEAKEIWERLRPGAEGTQLLTNGDFGSLPSSRGLDWHLGSIEGVSVSQEEHGVRVTFSGREPEECEALAQLVPLTGSMRYELQFGYRTAGIASGAALGWRITDAASGAVLRDGPSLASDAEVEQRLDFETPGECRLVRLALCYRRMPGTTLMEGFLNLRGAQLQAVGHSPPQSPMDGARVRR